MAEAGPIPNNESPGPSLAGYRRVRIGPRAALICGFSALLVLMAILALDSIRALRELEAGSSRIRREYVDRERALGQIRVSLYESGNLLSEYGLSDSSPETRRSYLAQLHDIRDHANAAMESSMRQLPASLQDPLGKLGGQLESYWLAADRTINEGLQKTNQTLLHRAALDRRATVLAIASEVSVVNELELRQAELEISNVFARSRGRLQSFTALAMGIGLVLATASILYVSRLEGQAEEKYLESMRYQSELKALSKRLVDAQEEERRAISRELHDQIAQTLTALLMNVQDLIEGSRDLDYASRGLQKIRLQAQDCVNKVRNMALLLRPSMLDDLGLLAALEWQGREVCKRAGLAVEVIDHDFDDDLPEEYKTCIYRVVQEALNNCTAHAKASRVRIVLGEDTTHYILTISDDGVGFDPARKHGMGLLGMQERVSRLGGTFFIDSGPGKGTSIRVGLPLAQSPEHEDNPA